MSEAVLVTGASRGVGRAVALELARRGVGLGLVGRASAAHTETARLARELTAAPVAEIFADFADAASLAAAAGQFLASFSAPAAVVHSAGVVVREQVEATSVEAWDLQFATNLRAPFVLTRALLPALRARGRGKLVFVGSISSTIGSNGAAAYAASKWGLVGFVKSLAEELRDSGVSACAVLPGSIDTEMLKGSGFPPRMSAEEVAKTIAFFALDAPAAHNGGVIEMFGV